MATARTTLCLYAVLLSLASGAHAAPMSFFKQINDDGFRNHHTTGGLERKTMAVFQDKLYVGAANRNDGAALMCYDGNTWTQAAENGLGSPANTAITCLHATDKKLYVGTSNKSGGQVWEYDGTNWRCLHKGPFGSFLSYLVMGLAYYKGRIYVGLWDQIETKPVEVWAGDEQGNWQMVSEPGLGDKENEAIPSMTLSSVDGQEKVYVAVWKDFEYRGADTGCEIWSFDGQTWEKRNRGREGFGPLNKGRMGMEPLALFDFNNRLYVGLWDFGSGGPGELWSFDGTDWTETSKGITTRLQSIYAMASCKNKLYAVASNAYGKFELWEHDGSTWTRLIGKNSPTPENFGNVDNTNISTMACYRGALYLGVTNMQTGFKVFKSTFPEILPAFDTAATGTMKLLSLSEDMVPGFWTSSDPAVASVDAHTGLFKAVAPGSCVMTAYAPAAAAASDNRTARGITLASKKITVTPDRAPQKDALLLYGRCVPQAAPNDGTGRVKAEITPYTTGTAGRLARARIDLSALGGAVQDLYDDGTHGDRRGGDGIFSAALAVPKKARPGNYDLPVTGTTDAGTTGRGRAVLSVTMGYTRPELAYLEIRESVYHIPVLFALRDPDGDENAVVFEYQKDGGPWKPATVYSQSGMLTFGATRGKMNKLAKLKTVREVNHFVCVWESEKDIGRSAGTYRLRATPADAKSSGAPLVAGPFSVNNQSPPKNEMIYVPNGDFYIDKYEYPNHYGYYPMLRRTWKEACAECEKQGKQLCTPEQWEAAYYGNKKLRFPYGNESKVSGRDYCNTYGSLDYSAVPSGLYENCVNDLGIHDMGGNVYEWASRSEKEVFMADQSYLLTSIDAHLMNVEGKDHRHEFLGHRCCRAAEKKK